MGVQARQFRTVASIDRKNRAAPNRLRATNAYCGEPTQTAISGVFEAHLAPGRRKRLVR